MKHESLILFTCAACGYRARIPRSYDGTAIVCPSCQHQQVAEAKDDKPRTGNTQILTQPKSAAASNVPAAAAVAVNDPPAAQAKSAEPAAQAVKPPGLTLTPLGTPALKVPAASSSSADGKISFHCGKCGAKTRIPSEYAGRVVRCPSCESIQIAMPGASPTTGRIVKGVAANTPKTAKLDDSGKIIFVCTNCQFQGRLAQNYAGKAIQCPSCRQPQVVDLMPAGSTGSESPGGTDVMTMTAVVRRSDSEAAKPATAAVMNAPPPLKKVTELNPPMTASPTAAPGQTPGGRTPTPATLLPESRPLPKAASPAQAQAQTPAKPGAPATGTVPKSFPTPAPTTGKIVRRGNSSGGNAGTTTPKPIEPTAPSTGPASTGPASTATAGDQVEALKSSARGMLLGLSGAVVVLLIIALFLWIQLSGVRAELDQARQQVETLKDDLKSAKTTKEAAQAEVKVLGEEKTKAVAERDAARTERDTAQAEREAARTEREAAATARDEARKERDEARTERDQLRKAAAGVR
ncbi:hypothetical protein LBMAG53_25270 [Planctomycetota bacterium]|nr:hypothetical protein LBMAG53_25270 [Planctomycetota bacterium]